MPLPPSRPLCLAGLSLLLAAALGYSLGVTRAVGQAQEAPAPVHLLSRGGARALTGQTPLQVVTAPTGRISGAVTFRLEKPFLSTPQVVLTAVEGGNGQAIVPMVDSVSTTGFTYTAHAPFLRGPEIRFRINWIALGEVPAAPPPAAPPAAP